MEHAFDIADTLHVVHHSLGFDGIVELVRHHIWAAVRLGCLGALI